MRRLARYWGHEQQRRKGNWVGLSLCPINFLRFGRNVGVSLARTAPWCQSWHMLQGTGWYTVMTTENRPGFLGFAHVGSVFISAKWKGYHLKALPKGFQMAHWNPTSASTRPQQRPKTGKNGPSLNWSGAKASWPLKAKCSPKVA